MRQILKTNFLEIIVKSFGSICDSISKNVILCLRWTFPLSPPSLPDS